MVCGTLFQKSYNKYRVGAPFPGNPTIKWFMGSTLQVYRILPFSSKSYNKQFMGSLFQAIPQKTGAVWDPHFPGDPTINGVYGIPFSRKSHNKQSSFPAPPNPFIP